MKSRSFGIVISGLCLIFFILGISLPFILVSGQLFSFVTISEEERSILSLIKDLLINKFILGMLVLLLALIIPVFKLSYTLFTLLSNKPLNKRLENIISHVGKWAMADVFSTAIIIAFMSFKNMGINVFTTDGELLVGFYFFVGYVLLSILSSYFLEKKILVNN